jgi:putative tryptophan/tyrosine transport system substrate-binding protein
VTDPVGSGFVASLAHPGGNITGFTNFEPALVGKHIEILKEITPGTTTIAVMFNPDNIVARLNLVGPAYAAAGQSSGVDIVSAPVRNDTDIERVVADLSGHPEKSLIVSGEPFFGGRRIDLLNSLTTRYRVPALYSFRFNVEAGGLISYGNDLAQQYRQAAGYIDRILKGANPADLPVQLPTKFEMVVNLKTAKAIGLTLPPTLLARADKVIE